MSVLKLAVFDWDGTIMDSAARIVACFQAAADDIGVARPQPEKVRQMIGLDLSEAWQRIKPDEPQAVIDALVAGYRQHFLAKNGVSMPLYDGVAEGLQRLDEAGILLAVATGKSRRGLDRAFSELEFSPLFVASRCGDETFPKPHPQMLLELLEVTGVEASDAVMIGDTSYDMEMARSAGVPSVAVSYGVHAVSQLSPLATHGVVDSFSEVIDTVLSQ